jgi:membrane protease YdiL (CAAX protease family)
VASGRHVKAQDRYLPSFQMRASYPTNYLPLGRSASPQLLRWC